MRVLRRLRVGIDRSTCDAFTSAHRDHLVDRKTCAPLCGHRVAFSAMLHAPRDSRVVGIVCQVSAVADSRQHFPVGIQQRSHHHNAISAMERVTGYREGKFVAHSRHGHPERPQREVTVGLKNSRVQQRHIAMLSLAGAGAMLQRCERRDRSVQSRQVITQKSRSLARPSLDRPIERHESGHRLREWIIADSVVNWAELSEAADRNVNDVGLHVTTRGIANSPLVEGAGPEVLHHDVGISGELQENLAPSRCAQIEREAALVAIYRGLKKTYRAGRAGQEWRDSTPHFPGWILDFDNIRAEIRQDASTHRTRPARRGFEHANPGQRSRQVLARIAIKVRLFHRPSPFSKTRGCYCAARRSDKPTGEDFARRLALGRFRSLSLSMAETQFFVGVHGVIANRGRLLVLKRSDLINYCPGAWDLPGGHLALGESAEEGLRREIKEETSLDVAVERLLGLHNMIHEPYMQALYACRLAVYRSLTLQPDEHLEARWVTPAELEELELIPYLERILKRGMLAYLK